LVNACIRALTHIGGGIGVTGLDFEGEALPVEGSYVPLPVLENVTFGEIEIGRGSGNLKAPEDTMNLGGQR